MKSRGDSSGRRITTTPESSLATRRIAARSGQPSFSLLTPDDIAQGVLDMHAHQRRQRRVQIALDQRNVHGFVDVVLVAAQVEGTVFGIHGLIVDPLDRTLVLQAVADQIRDRADLQAVSFREPFEIRAPRHGAVVVQDLDDHGGGGKSGQARQIAARFRVAGARQHTAGLRHQRKNMSGLAQIFRTGIRRHRGFDRVRAIVRGDSRGHAFRGLDRQGEVGAMRACRCRSP